MADEISQAIQIIRLEFDGLRFGMNVTGTTAKQVKNLTIFLYALLTREKLQGRTSLKKMISKDGNLQVLKIKETDYIYAAKISGCKTIHIITRHIIPNIIPTLITTATTDIGTMILELSSLSFLGFGAQSPQAEWGLMLNEGRAYMLDCPWLMIYPGLAICIVVVVYNLLGDNLRDILDSKKAIEEVEIEKVI